MRLNYEKESFCATGGRKKLSASVLMGFVVIAIFFAAMGCFYQVRPYQEVRSSVTEKTNATVKKRT